MQQVHILRRQLKVVDVGVLLNPRVRHRFWQWHEPLQKRQLLNLIYHVGSSHLLQTPPNQHLCGCLPILLCQNLQAFLLKSLPPYQRTVSFDNHAPLLAPLHNVGPREPGMQFPLPNADLAALAFSVLALKFGDVRLQFVEMVGAVVGDADGADQSGALGFDESEPGAFASCSAAIGGMD